MSFKTSAFSPYTQIGQPFDQRFHREWGHGHCQRGLGAFFGRIKTQAGTAPAAAAAAAAISPVMGTAQ